MKVIIWGHKLHSHTHSYIHHSFYKAFLFLGYETHWMDDNDDVSGFDFSDCLFLTEGQVDKNIPIRKDCKYILHNCSNRYAEVMDNCINIQVFSNAVYKYNVEKIGNHIHYDSNGRTLYQYWATDLLPHEIQYVRVDKVKEVYWIGTVGDGVFGNINELAGFQKACLLHGVQFIQKTGVGFEKSVELIRKSFLAPTINGKWQLENGYIPCRIFKNISYGQMGLTNNKTVQDLFEGKLIYDENTFDLFNKGREFLDAANHNEKLLELMEIVKNEHTYINRINTIMKFL